MESKKLNDKPETLEPTQHKDTSKIITRCIYDEICSKNKL